MDRIGRMYVEQFMGRPSSTILLVVLCPMLSAPRCDPDPPVLLDEPGASAEVEESEPAAVHASDGGGASSTGKRDRLLAELTTRLDRVQTAAPEDQVSTGGGVALEPLLGMSRAELRAALGAPNTCGGNRGGETDGRRARVAPCQTGDDWFYSFYHLPEGSVGGGPELLLQFDEKGTCVSARWVLTQ